MFGGYLSVFDKISRYHRYLLSLLIPKKVVVAKINAYIINDTKLEGVKFIAPKKLDVDNRSPLEVP